MKPRYFEIYVSGHNGFSLMVKTNKPLTNLTVGDDIEKTILKLAVNAKILEQGDAKEVYNGDGYIEEKQESDSVEWGEI